MKIGGFWWVLTGLSSLLLLISGIVALFSIVYASYSDLQNLRTGNLVRSIFPVIFIGFLILQWILYGIAFSTSNIPVQIDGWGLGLNIISILLIIAAMYRDLLFKEELVSEAKGGK
jgi:cytochrome b subunit of formate dehydrogenase